MIDAQLFTAFIVAATILILMPGPIVGLVVADTVARTGRELVSRQSPARASATPS